MNVAIYVKDLQTPSPASTRFQDMVLSGLDEVGAGAYHFHVFCDAVPAGVADRPGRSYVAIATPDRAARLARTLQLLVGGASRRLLRLVGGGGTAAYRRLTEWLAYDPPHHRQLRERNVRIVWNLAEKVMPSPLPFILVIWDINQLIYSMMPEYSYTRFGFEPVLAVAENARRASYIIVGTEEGKKQVQGLLQAHEDKIRIVPFATPRLPVAGENPARADAAPYVFYPARFWPHKNHVVIVHALKLLKDRGRAVRAVFSGIDAGNLGHVMRTAAALGVEDRVEYVGNVPPEQLSALYKDAAALVYASFVGPDNLPPLEAMALDCPVIAAEVLGAHEQYGDAALLFPPTSESTLADHIEALIETPALRAELIEHGRRRAAAWTSRDYVQSVLKILDEFALIARAWERSDSRFT